MINWIKNLFKDKPAFLVTEYHPEYEYTGISEPVWSFVETVRKNPKRFSVWDYTDYYSNGDHNLYCGIHDKQTKENFMIQHNPENYIHIKHSPWKRVDFLTDKEEQFIYKELCEIYKNWPERKEQYIKLKKMRKDRDERNRLKNIYCN